MSSISNHLVNHKPVDPQELFEFFLNVDHEKLEKQTSDEAQGNKDYFQKDVIEGRQWLKGEMKISTLLDAHINPGSKWLKRFSCKCLKYPCDQCKNDNLLKFSDFAHNHHHILEQINNTNWICNDRMNWQEILNLEESVRIALEHRLIVHETNGQWYNKYKILNGSLVVRDGNHRVAALIRAQINDDYNIPVYFGISKKPND